MDVRVGLGALGGVGPYCQALGPPAATRSGGGCLFDLPPGAVGWGARRIGAGGKVFGSQQKA